MRAETPPQKKRYSGAQPSSATVWHVNCLSVLMLVSDNDVKVVVQMQPCTFFFFKVKTCVTAVVRKTHLQCVLLSAQRRETAVRTRGCTDKSLEVLGGFTGVLTIAALGGLLLDYLHTQVNTFSGSFLSCYIGSVLLSVFALEAHYLPCWHYKMDFITGTPGTTLFGFSSKVWYHRDLLHKLWQMSEIKWRFDSLFTFKLGRLPWNLTGKEIFFLFHTCP